MRTLALAGILGLALRQVIHARRVLADLLNLDGDPDTRCTSSWCWMDHGDVDFCGEPFRSLAGTLFVCTLRDGHTGHHHDQDGDARWSRRWTA